MDIKAIISYISTVYRTYSNVLRHSQTICGQSACSNTHKKYSIQIIVWDYGNYTPEIHQFYEENQ